MSDYGPSISACRLYRKTSAKGVTYFTGRWGMMKVALLKSKDVADDGAEIWNLVVSQAPAPQQRADSQPAAAKSQAPLDRPQPNFDRPMDDEIPF